MIPKPSKRAPRPRKAIKRGKRPARRVRIARVSKKHGQVSKADSEWSAMVRERAGGHCERTGRAGTDAHHVFTKGAHPRLRYDLDNGILLTRAEHRRAHRSMKAFRAWFAKVFPETWARLEEKAKREARLIG